MPKQPKLKQRLGQFLRLVRVLINEFRGFFICLFSAFAVSTLILYTVYPRAELPPHHHSLLGIAFDTWQMIFFQTPIPFVDDWRLVPLFFGLPILGLLVIAEGVVHLGNLLFQHKRYSQEWQHMLASTFENHVVVCGLGNVGIRVVQQLRRIGENVVSIERNSEAPFIREMESYQVPVLIGDSRDIKMLENANVVRAKALISVTDDDLANVEAALNARELSPGIRVVIRMFDQRLAKKIEKSLGINSAFSASALSAPVFAQAAVSGDIVSAFEFAGTVVNALSWTARDGSPLIGITLEDVRRQYEATVLMQETDGRMIWNPASSNVVAAGDRLLIVTDQDSMQRLQAADVTAENRLKSV